jgi:serine/threonine protein kinase
MGQSASQLTIRIGGYRILEKIGKGGMGTVYKGQDPTTGRIVAVKVVGGEVAADPVLRMRFAQECQIARKLDHPHAVQVLDFGLDGTKPYLVMEYVDGESLGERLEREGRLPEAEAVRLIGQVGQALAWAHKRRFIHRDVKPDNILVTADGQAKLTDLGLVKNLEGDFNLTNTLSCLGTPNFMAPEQFEDAKRVEERSDLYSLAATLYELVTGELPFRARSVKAVGAIYKKKIADDITPPRQLVPELSERVESAILRALRCDRNQRQASVLEFIESLTEKPEPKAAPTEPETVPAVSSPPTARESRSTKRRSSRRCTVCRPLQRAPGKTWAGQVLNLSEDGLCMKLGRRFEPGALLAIVLNGEQSSRRLLVARVVWVKKDATAQWNMGCRFDQPLYEFEVNELC